MKKKITKTAIILAFAIIGIVGCTEFTEKIDDFKIGVASTIFDQNAVIQLTDYNQDHAALNNADLSVTLSGADADKFVNEAGENAIGVTQGFIQLNVNPNKSQGVKTLNFNLTVSGGTYRTATFPVTLTDSTTFLQFQMVNEAKLIGTDKKSSTANLTNNATTAAITVATTKAKSTNTSTVTIDAGTQFKDVSGTSISGGNVKIEVANVDPIGESIDPDYAGNKEFKDATGAVITDKIPVLNGRTNIKMEIGGKQVKQSDKPISVSITIPSDSNNPATGNKVQIGDTYPIYTNEEGSDIWTYHGTGTVVAGADANTFKLDFTTTHLSNYSTVSFVDKAACGDYKINITAPNAAADFSGNWALHFAFDNGRSHYSQGVSFINIENGALSIDHRGSGALSFLNSGRFTKDEIQDLINGKKIKHFNLYLFNFKTRVQTGLSTLGAFANCNLDINISSLAVNSASEENIDIDVSANCDGNTLVPDGFPVYVERADGSFSYEGTLKNGKLTLYGFELNKEYNFKTFYKENVYTQKWTFTSTSFVEKDFVIPDSVCNDIGF